MMKSSETTYRQLADSVQGMIEQGTLRAGDRLPSLRRMARDYRVSVSTVMSAYEVLENRSLVDARDRSGFFVRARIPSAERIPKRQTGNFSGRGDRTKCRGRVCFPTASCVAATVNYPRIPSKRRW